jgi:hypothetical protein
MAEEQHCRQEASLKTTFVSDTQAYGVMFTVMGKQDPLIIETLELSSIFLANQKDIHVIVYTKEGGYQNFQNNPNAWIRVADTYLTPAREGRGTLIPARQFNPVELDSNSQRAFYVTLDTSDLRYSNSPGRPVGSVYVQDDFLQIQVGAGLLEYPFSNLLFQPRVFCGIVHYKRIVDCDKVAIVSSKVSYTFLVQHDNTSENVVVSQVNAIIRGSIVALLGSDIDLAPYKTTAGLKLDSVDTSISTGFFPEAYAECVSNTVRTCTAVVTDMKFTHTEKLSKGDLVYRMLLHRIQLASNLNMGNSMDVTYAGIIPIQAQMIVRLDDVPTGRTMNPKQRSYFEDTTRKFIEDKLSRMPSVHILNVRVNEQDSLGRRLLTDQRQLQDEQSLSSVDLSIDVIGTLQPPPFVDFDFLVEDAIDLNAAEYLDDLVNRRDLKLDGQDSKFFDAVSSVAARPLTGTDRNSVSSSSSEGNGKLIGWAVLLVVFLVLVVVALFWRRLRRREYGKEDIPSHGRSSTEAVDDNIAQAYENAFHGFVDEKDAEIMGQRGPNDRWLSSLTHATKNARFMPQRSMTPPPTSQSGSGHLRSTRSTGAASSGYSSSQRGLTSQSSTTDVNYSSSQRGSMASSGFSSSLRGLPSQNSTTDVNYSSSQRGLMASPGYSSSLRGLTSQSSTTDVNYSSSQRGLVANSGYSSSLRGLPSQNSTTDVNYSSSQRGIMAQTGPPGSALDNSRRNMMRVPSVRADDASSVGMSATTEYPRSRSDRRVSDKSDDASTMGMGGATTEYPRSHSSRVDRRVSDKSDDASSVGVGGGATTNYSRSHSSRSDRRASDKSGDASSVGMAGATTDYSRSHSSRVDRRVSDKSDDASSVGMGGATTDYSRSHSSRVDRRVSDKSRNHRSAAARSDDDVNTIGLKPTPHTLTPDERIPVPEEHVGYHDDGSSSMGDASVISSAVDSRNSDQTVKRNNRVSSTDELSASSQHTVKRNNNANRGLGAADDEILDAYTKKPETLLNQS